jgi:hypothetical protein
MNRYTPPITVTYQPDNEDPVKEIADELSQRLSDMYTQGYVEGSYEMKEKIMKEVSSAVGAVETGIISKEKGYGEIIDIIKKL